MALFSPQCCWVPLRVPGGGLGTAGRLDVWVAALRGKVAQYWVSLDMPS